MKKIVILLIFITIVLLVTWSGILWVYLHRDEMFDKHADTETTLPSVSTFKEQDKKSLFTDIKETVTNNIISSEPPNLEVSNYPSPLFDLLAQIEVRSLEDSIVIKGFTINRGNCTIVEPMVKKLEESGGETLKFGKAVTTMTNCPVNSVREIVVHTDRGDWVYKFTPNGN